MLGSGKQSLATADRVHEESWSVDRQCASMCSTKRYGYVDLNLLIHLYSAGGEGNLLQYILLRPEIIRQRGSLAAAAAEHLLLPALLIRLRLIVPL